MPKNLSYLRAYLFRHRFLQLAAVVILLGVITLSRTQLSGARSVAPPDSDGDGQNDLAEFLAGTNPHDSKSVFRIVAEPVRLPSGLWRVSWQSIPTRRYTLQRLTDGSPDFSEEKWVDVGSVVADGPITSFDAPVAAARGFFRVRSASLSDAPTLLAPIAITNGGWRLFWSSVLGRNYELQRAQQPQSTNTLWRDVVQVAATGPVAFADDTTGSAATSRFYRVLELPNPPPSGSPIAITNVSQFVPIGNDARPQEGVQVQVVAGGTLPAFEFRPGGHSGGGPGAGLLLRFPQGARVVEQGGKQYLEFTSASALFGPGSPIQFATLKTTSGGSVRRIPLGAPSVADLLAAFGTALDEGLDLVLFDQFHVTLKGGVFEDGRLKQARFSVDLGGLPLPGISGDYPEFAIDLPPTDGIRIPFFGDFTLPDGSDASPTLSIPASHPLWLTIKPDALPSLSGRADLKFPDGPSFSVDLGLDDPVYRIEMVATGLHVPLIGSLATLLPATPETCIPPNATLAQITEARLCLFRYDCAFVNFSASTVGAAPASEAVNTPNAPPDEFNTATSVLDAWSYSALASAGTHLPLAPLKDLLKQTARSAAAAQDLNSVVCNQLALVRAKQAIASGALEGSSAAGAELDSAIATASAAAIRAADSKEAALNLGNLLAATRCVLEVRALGQLIDNAPLDPPLAAAIARLFKRFASDECNRLGIVRGEFLVSASGPIAGMNRFVALQRMKDWTEFLGDAQLLAVDMEVDSPVQEALSQLALRVWHLVQARLNEAETANDYLGFLYSLEDILDLVRLRQSGLLPDNAALAILPRDSELRDFGSRLGAVFARDPSRLTGDVALPNQAAEVRRLVRILHEVPSDLTFAAAPCQRAYERLETSLTTAFNTLTAHRDLSTLLDLLEAGKLHAQLRDQFHFAEAASWENAQLPILVGRIVEIAKEKQAWSELHKTVQCLLSEANRYAVAHDLAKAQACLGQAVAALHGSREVAVGLWQDESARRTAHPLLQVADLLLPGDLHVDKVAGSVRYDRSSRALEGAFSGELRLPKFDLAFTLANASFTSGGAFDINAFGSVVMPSAADPRLKLSVTPEHPLHVQFKRPRELKVSGGGKVEAGGATFEAYFGLEDPLYVFGASAQGIRFDLADKLKSLAPTLAADAVFDAATARVLNDYYRSLNASFETFAFSSSSPAAASLTLQDTPATPPIAADPPTFKPTFEPSPLDALEAWANSELSDAQMHVVKDYTATVNTVKRQFQGVADSLRSKPGKLDLPGLLVRSALMKRICDALRSEQVKPNQGNFLILVSSPEFAAFLTETENAILNLLRSDDPALAARASEVAELAGGFSQQIQCFQAEHDSSALLTAFQQFLGLQTESLFAQLGLSPSSGEPLPGREKLDSLTRDELRTGMTNLMLFSNYQVRSGSQSTLLNYRYAIGVVALQLRHLTYKRMLELAPANTEAFYAKLDQLRHKKKDPGPCKDPEVPDLLALYAELRALKNDIFFLILAGESAFDWPAGGIEQPYDVPGHFDQRIEIQNATKSWNAAVLFSSNAKPNGDPLANGKDNSVTRCEWVEKYVEEEHRTRRVLVTRHLDWENLVGDDFSLGSPAKAKSAEAMARDAAAQAVIDKAAKAKVDIAETELLQKAGIVREAAGIELLKKLIELTTWAQKHDPSQLPLLQLRRGQLVAAVIDASTGGSAPAGLGLADAGPVAQAPQWLLLADYTRQLIEASELAVFSDASDLRQSLLTDASRLIRAAAASATKLGSLLPHISPSDLKLPGNLVINRIFGEVQFNKDTRKVNGTFGGRLEFPDLQNAYFEINRATLNSDFQFSIDAKTGGPLPFDGVWITAAVVASGGLHDPVVLHGTGTMTLTNGPDFAVSLNYDAAAGTLAFDTAVTDLQSLRLTDNAVFFDAGFGFSVKPSAQSGELHVSGTAGFFAKGALPATVTRKNFHLIADQVAASLAFHPGRLDLRLTNGTLRLPEMFKAGLCLPNNPGSGPSVSLSPTKPITASLTFEDIHQPPTLRFGGEIDFANIGLNVPDMEGWGAELCSAKLLFSDDRLPYFTNIIGAVAIPLPPGQTSRVDILDGAWSVDGFPTGKIALRNDVKLIDHGGFAFTLLAAHSDSCPHGSALTVSRSANNLPRFALDGGIQLGVPVSMLSGETGDAIKSITCGTLFLDPPPALPDLRIDTFALGGTFHLGGANGLVVSNALLTLSGFENLFHPTTDHPFQAHLGGTLQVPNGPAFTLNDARFVFFDSQRLPRFDIAGMGYDGRQFKLAQALPARVSAASFTFKNRNLEIPALLSPDNLTLTVSASVAIPSPEDPYISGTIDAMKVSIDSKGLPQIESIAGLGMQIGGVPLPPIEELGGQVYIGGLSPDPTKMYFAGRVAGSYQGYKIKALMAFNLAGPIGMCLDVNAGNVGIPLGQTGILISGASGGISFVNKNTDPCDFATYMNTDGKPLSTMVELPAAMSWASLKDVTNRFFHAVQAFRPFPAPPQLAGVDSVVDEPSSAAPVSLSGLPTLPVGFDCPGDCPPATVNIFCQPHPDTTNFANRVIAKFSSIDESTLNNVLHITPDTIAALGQDAASVATEAAHKVRTYVFSVTPPPQVGVLGAARTAQIAAVVNEALDAMEHVFADALKEALSGHNVAEFYGLIRNKAYAGAPCPDCTLKVTGTITHVAVSSFLSGTVGATLSTAGTIGLVGNVNVLGIPVGKAKGFVAATDAQGLPNPSVCGDVRAVVGPLDLGDLAASMSCKDCVTGVLAEFGKLAQCLGEPLIRQIVGKVAPLLTAGSPTQLLNSMSDTEKLAFMAELLQAPPQGDVANCFLTQFSAAWDRVQPQLLLCGQVEPKLFGFPMAGKLVEVKAGATKTNIAGLYSYSPTYMIAAALGGVTRVPVFFLFPPQDAATFGFNVNVPDPGQALLAGLSGRFRSPGDLAAYSREGFDFMLANATFTADYRLHPLGAEVLRAEMRVLIPNLTSHPARPGSTWVAPELRPGGLPSRWDVLLLALEGGKLGDPLWKATAADLQALDGRLAGMDLQHDYFPHGGMAGAAKLQFPKALTEAPPEYLPALIDPGSSMDILTRVGNAVDFLQNYVLAFTNRGALAFYVPAPNPPFFTHNDGSSLKPQELLSAIQSFDATTIQDVGVKQLYPVELAFMKGWFNAQLLGIPIATGSVVALPAGQGRSTGVLQVRVDGPSEGWMKSFVNNASLTFEMKQSPTLTISNWGSLALSEIAPLLKPAPANVTLANWDQLRRQKVQDFATALVTNLPKVSLDASIALSMPSPISDVVAANGAARVVAYSPRYEPTFVGQGPLANVRRDGGIAFVGNLDFKANGASIITVNNAELSVTPHTDGLPTLTGRFSVPTFGYQGVGLSRATLDFNTAPNPRFSASGEVSPVAVGAFRITPVSGVTLTGKVDIARSGPRTTTETIVLGAARVQLPGLFSETIFIHGEAGKTAPFSYSTTNPWSAVLEVTNGLTLKVAGVTMLQLSDPSALVTTTIAGTGSSTGSVAIAIQGGTKLSLFPGRTYAQSVTLASGSKGALRISSDGTFELTGSFDGSVPLKGLILPITTIASGSIRLTQDALTITGLLGAGVLDSLGSPGFTASGSVTLTRDGVATVSGGGQIQIPPMTSNVFTLESISADKITATLDNTGLLLSEIYLKVTGLFSDRVRIPSMRIYANGNFTNQLGPVGLKIGGFAFDSISFQLERSSGVWTLRNFSGRVTTFGSSATAVLTGNFSSDGSFNLVSSSGLSIGLGGFAMSSSSMAFVRVLPAAPTFSFSGSLAAGDFATLNLSGLAQPDGTYALSNVLTSTSIQGYPLLNVTNVLRNGVSDYRLLVLGASPLAYWRLGDTVGVSAKSETLKALDGTYRNGPNLLQPGALTGLVNANRSAGFNGKDQDVLIGNPVALGGIDGALTVEAWVKVGAFDASWQTIVSKGDSSWRLQRDANKDSLAFDTDGLNPPYLSGVRSVKDGQWHHVVAVYDGQAKYLYIDGELDAWIPAQGSIAKNAAPMLIGANSEAPNRNWNGGIDEVALYTHALTANEVQEHYRAGGGVVLTLSTRVNLPGLGGADLRGTLSDSGAFDLQGGPVSLQPGGFPLSSGQLRFTRQAQQAPSLSFAAKLNVPAGPVVEVDGSIATTGVLDLTGTVSAGRLAVFDFGDLRFNLTGSLNAPTLSATGLLSVVDLGSLGFSGVVGANGNLALTNVFTGPKWFDFPAGSITNVIRRGAGDYRSAAVSDGPVAYWRLNEASDTDKVLDAVGLHPGVFQGAVNVLQSGALVGSGDHSVLFDGKSGFVAVGREFDFDFTRTLATEVWIKVPKKGWTHDWQAIVTKGDSSWRVSRYSNTSKVSFDTTSAAGNHSLIGLSDVDDGQWHHVVAVYDGMAKLLYVDGELEAWAAYSESLSQNNAPVQIGANSEAPGRFFNGWLDEVAIYGRALNAAEVLDHYLAGGGSVISTRLKLAFGGPLNNVELAGTLAPNGSVSLQATVGSVGLRGFTLKNFSLGFSRLAGGTTDVNLAGDLSLGALDVTPHFTGTLSSLGFLVMGIDGVGAKVRNFPFNNLSMAILGNVSQTSGSLAIGGDLAVPNFPSYHLQGTISSGNNVGMNYSNGLNLGGFAAANGTLTFSSFLGLYASGKFDLSVPNATFNSGFQFAGNVNPDGSFGLVGNGALGIGGFFTTTNSFTLDATHVSGSTALKLGGVANQISVSVSLNSSGITVNGSGDVDTGWNKVIDWPPDGDSVGDVSWRATGSLSVSSTSVGAITGSLGGTFAVWENLGSGPPINITDASHRVGDTWSVDSTGAAKVSFGFTGVTVDLKRIPPRFKQTDWTVDLW